MMEKMEKCSCPYDVDVDVVQMMNENIFRTSRKPFKVLDGNFE